MHTYLNTRKLPSEQLFLQDAQCLVYVSAGHEGVNIPCVRTLRLGQRLLCLGLLRTQNSTPAARHTRVYSEYRYRSLR